MKFKRWFNKVTYILWNWQFRSNKDDFWRLYYRTCKIPHSRIAN